MLRHARRLLQSAEPCQALILEAQIPKTDCQTQCDQDQENLANAPWTMRFFFIEEVVEIGTLGGMRVDAQAGAFTGGASARNRLIQPEKRRAADGGRCFRNGGGRTMRIGFWSRSSGRFGSGRLWGGDGHGLWRRCSRAWLR